VSASEKLRALDAKIKVIDAGANEVKVIDALPQIVAVVEAAEHMDVWIEHGCDHFANGQEAVAPFRAALAALDEALS
jgi:hypothetical protein